MIQADKPDWYNISRYTMHLACHPVFIIDSPLHTLRRRGRAQSSLPQIGARLSLLRQFVAEPNNCFCFNLLSRSDSKKTIPQNSSIFQAETRLQKISHCMRSRRLRVWHAICFEITERMRACNKSGTSQVKSEEQIT